ncbi:MAG: hypothetical protein PHH32_00180 [Eubacteriales bacterium]|nr:hypothetical protein [Eubacteriales bacterium]
MAIKKTVDPVADPIKEEAAVLPEKKPEKAAEPARAQTKAAAKKPAYLMYLGPTLRGYISKNQIIPRHRLQALEGVKEKFPDVIYLTVTGDQVASARAKIKSAGNYLAAAYERLAVKAEQ